MANKPDRRNFQLETWMEHLPKDIRTRAISRLVIPGSRHSTTYNIDGKSELADDSVLKELSGIFKVMGRRILARWSRVQRVSLTTQLCMGIRYFDIRVQFDESTGLIWSVYRMKSNLLSVGLAQVNDFLRSHPKEIVILDFQHFVDFLGPESHSRLKNMLHEAFQDRLCPSDFPIPKLSLESMHAKGFQVIVVYRDFRTHSNFLRGEFFPIAYSKTDNPSDLRKRAVSHVSISWPDAWCLIVHMVLRPQRHQKSKWLLGDGQSYAKTALKETRLYVEYLRTMASRPAVIVADHVHINDAEFSRLVVNLNYSYLEPTPEPQTQKRTVRKRTKTTPKRSSSDEGLKRMGSL